EPQFDGLVLLAELGQTNVPAPPVFITSPPVGKVRPVTAGAVTGRAGTEIVRELVRRRQRSPDEAKEEINRKIGEVRPGEFRDRPTGQDQRLHRTHPLRKTRRAPKTSATQRPPAPAAVILTPPPARRRRCRARGSRPG